MKFTLDEPYTGLRDNDPDLDCMDFERGEQSGDCDADGHYMCEYCRQRNPDKEE